MPKNNILKKVEKFLKSKAKPKKVKRKVKITPRPRTTRKKAKRTA